ncbi:MAG: hypothetical protein D6719_09170 [Candidatus Dadabacteria bacterium]|nr:MAG: hypothetical protein D6719_09170 [Candidatus Dadabacteria bacterium]
MNFVTRGHDRSTQILIVVVAVAATVALGSALIFTLKRRAVNNVPANTLALWDDANGHGPLAVDIYRPIEMNFLPKAEVYNLRVMAVNRNRELVKGNYTPSEKVFGEIESKRPWYGIHGHYVWASGERSIEGPAYESKFLFNPFNLVGIEFWGLTGWGKSKLRWNRIKIEKAGLNSKDFPFYPLAYDLIWYPDKGYYEIKYDVSGYLREVNKYTVTPVGKDSIEFGLVAYNARDFGLNYIFLDLKHSENITTKIKVSEPLEIKDYLYLSNKCGYPGGCIYHWPGTTKYDYISVTGLPARAEFKLYRDKPELENVRPDLRAIIYFM